MQTSLWAWADAQGLSLAALARRLGYSPEHLSRLRSFAYPITPAFAGRVVLVLGDWARALFTDCPTAPESGAER